MSIKTKQKPLKEKHKEFKEEKLNLYNKERCIIEMVKNQVQFQILGLILSITGALLLSWSLLFNSNIILGNIFINAEGTGFLLLIAGAFYLLIQYLNQR